MNWAQFSTKISDLDKKVMKEKENYENLNKVIYALKKTEVEQNQEPENSFNEKKKTLIIENNENLQAQISSLKEDI